jgi:hypothetical protein
VCGWGCVPSDVGAGLLAIGYLFARYAWEPEDKRRMPVWFYDWKNATPYSEDVHGALRREIARLLQA